MGKMDMMIIGKMQTLTNVIGTILKVVANVMEKVKENGYGSR